MFNMQYVLLNVQDLGQVFLKALYITIASEIPTTPCRCAAAAAHHQRARPGPRIQELHLAVRPELRDPLVLVLKPGRGAALLAPASPWPVRSGHPDAFWDS